MSYRSITNEGTNFYFKTNLNAPLGKVVRYDLSHPDQVNIINSQFLLHFICLSSFYLLTSFVIFINLKGFVDIIKQHSEDVLTNAIVVAETNLILIYMHDVHEIICIHDLPTGKHKTNLSVPIGTVISCSGRKEDTDFFFKIANFLNPGIIYRYDFPNETLAEYKRTNLVGFNSDLFETKLMFTESKDKTRLPVFIIFPKVS